MATDALSAYAASSAANTATSTAKTKTSAMDMDDFLKLMVAQLQNQDMYNSTDNSEFMAQMAQYSMVQSLTEMTEQSKTAYSVSLIGKDVSLKETGTDGSQNIIMGTIDGVSLYNGETKIIVKGNSYDMSDILTVSQSK
jgi:Flagellar hook capping protein